MSGTFPYESYLLLAFRGLKVFSIPGVGTFVRKNLPAHLDEAHQIIYPPSEYIEFIPNQYQQVNAFVQLLEQSLNIPPHKAQAAADKIGKSLIEYLEKQKEITFPDIGKLKYTSKQELIFEPIASEIHLATFGLSPVSISVSSLSSNETRGSSNGKSTSSESLSSQAISPSGISRTPIYVVGLTVLILSVLILLMIFYSP
ncbi:MAG: hypothetical protein NZ576_07105, partial [Bacteroidia bacterium]|nr:hypothetical protein [Bacteroidia bacterium]